MIGQPPGPGFPLPAGIPQSPPGAPLPTGIPQSPPGFPLPAATPPPPLRAPPETERPRGIESIPENQRHQFERVVLAAKEEYFRRKKLLQKFMLAPSGRPAWNMPLTDEEKLARYLDFQRRRQILEALQNEPEKMRMYLDEMTQIAEAGGG